MTERQYATWADMIAGEYPLHVAAARLRHECEAFIVIRKPWWPMAWWARYVTKLYERELRMRPGWKTEEMKRRMTDIRKHAPWFWLWLLLRKADG